jgi:5-oxoprolinase (ATP-hydrolysing) subunit A
MMARTSIDLNADVGEGVGTDAELVPLVSSVNIACGGHAGDAESMRATILLAQLHGAAIGAHPGFADRENFGRKEIPVSDEEAAALVIGQVARLQEVAAGLGARVGHVKLHGALYNMAARDAVLATAVVAAIARHGDGSGGPLVLYALAGSIMVAEGRRMGLRVLGEGFADRAYRGDGSLRPRGEPGALIEDAGETAGQALLISTGEPVPVRGAPAVRIDAETLCLHGDSPAAVSSARAIRERLESAGIRIRTGY